MNEVYPAEDSKKGSGMANAAVGSVPLRAEVFMVTQNERCAQSHPSRTLIYIYKLHCTHSTSRKWMALMF